MSRKKNTHDYQFKSCILVQKTGSLIFQEVILGKEAAHNTNA